MTNKMMKKIQNFKTEFNKGIEILKEIQDEIGMELKNQYPNQETWRKATLESSSRQNIKPKYNVKDLDKISK